MHKLEDGLKDLQVEHCYELRGVLALLEAHREAQIGGVVEVREGGSTTRGGSRSWREHKTSPCLGAYTAGHTLDSGSST